MTNPDKRLIQPENLPNARTVLWLGVVAILLSWWHVFSVAGIISAIVSLVLAKQDLQRYHSSPGAYTIQSLNNLKVGRIFAIIGLAISVIIFFFVILMILGLLASLPFWGMIN